MAFNAFCIIILSISFECIQQNLIKADIVTAGTYYQMINTHNASVEKSDNNALVLTEEMFRCSKNAGCGSLGNKKNSYSFEEISNDADRSGYGKILEKVKSGEFESKKCKIWIALVSRFFSKKLPMKNPGSNWVELTHVDFCSVSTELPGLSSDKLNSLP